MASVLIWIGVLLGCGGPAPPSEQAVPAATSGEPPVAQPAVVPLDVLVDLSGGPLVYRMSWQPVEPSESAPQIGWFEDETVALELEGGARVVRGRCGPYRGIEDEGCLPFLFPEGGSLGEEPAAIEWRWAAAGQGGLHITGHAVAEPAEAGRVSVRAQTRHRFGSLLGGQSEISGQFVVDEARYEEVEHTIDVAIFPLDPTGSAPPAEQRGRLSLRFDEEATAARREGP